MPPVVQPPRPRRDRLIPAVLPPPRSRGREVSAAATPDPRRRTALVVGAVVLAFVAVGVLRGPGDSGVPLDPESVGPLGAKGLVDTLGELGADVRVAGDVEAETDVALLLTDRFDDAGRERLRAWVRAGGRLVVADPLSVLAPQVAGQTEVTIGDPSLERRCDLPLLADVSRVSAPGSAVYDAAPDAVTCFPRNGGHWLVASPLGEGVVVSLGGPFWLVNEQLERFDNAVFAAALLVEAGTEATQVTFLQAAGLGGTATIASLLPAGVKLFALQLGIGFLLLAWWRGRRLGAPVEERQPVAIPASETVLASGNLLQRAAAAGHAAQLLRDDLRATLAERFGVPAAAGDEALAAAAATRRTLPPERLGAVLTAPLPRNDDELVGFAAEVEAVRRLALVPQPTVTTSTTTS